MKGIRMKTLKFAAAGLLLATAATAQEQRFQVIPDATGGVWIFDSVRSAVSKCVRPEPEPLDGNQPRLVNPFEFYEDGNAVPHCSDWQVLSTEINQ